jgi:hypothetical protein
MFAQPRAARLAGGEDVDAAVAEVIAKLADVRGFSHPFDPFHSDKLGLAHLACVS